MSLDTGSPTVGLGRFIKENKFFVPTHQRDYSWSQSFAEQLLKDIDEAMSKNSAAYFFGLMVFTKSETNRLKVLDGQQRLATTLMIFSAIRNWYRANGSFKEQEIKLQSFYLENSDFGERSISSKLDLTPANNDIFVKYVIEPTHPSSIEKELKRRSDEDRNITLLKTAIYVNKYMFDKADKFLSHSDADAYFTKIVMYITDAVRILTFVVNDDDAAYTIFETLNDRGLELSPLDLIKNYIFSRAEKHRRGSLREFEDRWSEMIVTLGNAKSDSFLRSYWISKYGKYDANKIFRQFKELHKDASDAYNTSVDMLAASQKYSAIFNPNDATWARVDEKTRRAIESINVINPTQLHSILLAAIDNFDQHELERLIRLIEVISVRYQIIGKGRPGRMEDLGGRSAALIRSNKIKSATQVYDLLSGELYTTDEEFERQFSVKSIRDANKARYILEKLERQSILKDGMALSDELSPSNVTLEHILPKNPGDRWKQELEADPKILKDCLHRLGNMCLLPGINRALGNKSFDEKKVSYSQSRQRLTNRITQFDNWGRANISERQKWMAKLAVAEWRFQ